MCWVAEGWIDREQAARIEAGEAARGPATAPAVAPASGPAPAPAFGPAPEPGPAVHRGPLVVEALGYVGGVLAIVAGFIAVDQLWPRIPTGAQLAFAAAGCLALGAAAGVMRTGGEAAFGRLRNVLWLLSTACLAAFMGLLTSQVWHLAWETATPVSAAVATAYAAGLWWRTRAALQQLAMFAGAAVLVGTGIHLAAPGTDTWGPGLGVWVLSVAWGACAYRGYLAPQLAGYLATGIGLLTGAELTMQEAAGHVLALVTVAGLFAAGIALRRVWVLVLAAIGVLQVVPQTAVRYLPQSVAAPLAVFTVGLALLGVALWLARAHRAPKAR